MSNYGLQEYRGFLIKIYGNWTTIFLHFTPNTVQFRDASDIITEINKSQYGINEIAGNYCHECAETYANERPNKKLLFSERNMDFPSWIGSLDFSDLNSSKKKIMILGESVTGDFKFRKKTGLLKKRHINIAYEFGITFTEVEINSTQFPFWKRLRDLLEPIFPNWLDELYISDIALCNCDKKPKLIEKCTNKHLFEHILYIKPKLIIFLGHDAVQNFYFCLKDKCKKAEFRMDSFPKYVKKDRTHLSRDFYNSQNVREGILYLDDKKTQTIHFFTIPHPSSSNIYYSNQSEPIWKIINAHVRDYAINHGIIS